MDTPYSTTSYTDQLIRDQQARTLQDVFATDPTVRDLSPRLTFINQLFIRGFTTNVSDSLVKGLQGLAPIRKEFFSNIERVELLRGLSAIR